jgi:hypothetical protein
MFRAEVMLRELARLEPEIGAAAKGAVENLASDLDFYRLAEGPFTQALFKVMDVSRHKSVDTLRGYVHDTHVFRDHAGLILTAHRETIPALKGRDGDGRQ